MKLYPSWADTAKIVRYGLFYFYFYEVVVDRLLYVHITAHLIHRNYRSQSSADTVNLIGLVGMMCR